MTDRDHILDRILDSRLGFFAVMVIGLSALVASMFGVYELGYWIAGETFATLALLVYLLTLLAALATTD